MSKHTPGPWRYHAEDNGIYMDMDDECGPQIAEVTSENCDTDDQVHGDGLLIAAAPDLLEALQSLTEWGRTHTSPLDPNSPHDLLIAAMKAIIKATRETV